MDKIENLRELIDVLDDELMALLDQRFSLSLKIGNAKTHAKIKVLDTKRETTILEKTHKYSHSPEIGVVYKKIMEESKLLQRK
jgi:chorismate mutase